jgi:hypothetical protein
MRAPLPADAGTTPSVSLSSVSCVSAGNCVAVGSYQDSSGYSQGLLVSESSGSWTAAKAPLPANAGTNPSASLRWVSCVSAGNCVAVGSYRDSSGYSQGLLVSESSGSWTAAGATPPNNAGTNPSVTLNSVSCASAGNCVAIGAYRDSFTQIQALLVSESSGTWSTASQAPLPADGGTSGGHGLYSVSCSSAGNCAATGYYYDSSGHTQGLLLSESSGTWTPLKAPLPADAGTIPAANVLSVSCAAAGGCTAGGSYTDASGHSQGLLLSESSGTWSTGIEASLPSDAGTNPNAGIGSVSCVSAGTCSAVGFYEDSSGNEQGLLLSESSGTWSTGIKASLPSDAATNPSVELYALSCATAGSCAAINGYEDSSSHSQGLLVSAIPANPTLTLSAPTTGTVGSTLDSSTVRAVLSAGASPVGTITFRLFGPQASAPHSCASGGTMVGSASVSRDGAYHPSAGFDPTSAGDYWWYARYDGDTGDNPASSACGASMAETVVTSPTHVVTSVPPTLSAVRQSAKKWREGKALAHIARKRRPRVGTTFSFTLNEAARIRFAFTQTASGRKVKGKCVAPTKANRHRPKCTRILTRATLSFAGHKGANKVRFQGRVSRSKKLKLGRYTLVIIATNTAGQKSTPHKLTFTIVKG